MGFDVANFFSMLIIYMVVWIFSVSAHEFGHAWTSLKFGDDTAQRLGRVTLNPIPHIDPVGTLLLPIIGFLISFSQVGNFPLIAWGKPTPVNPLKWRNKDTANVCVSIAGIVINLTIAVIGASLIKILVYQGFLIPGIQQEGIARIVTQFLLALIYMNVGLAIFNLLPFPPLDGSKVLQTFLPKSFEPIFEILETYGFLILLILVQIGLIRFIVAPINSFVLYLLGV